MTDERLRRSARLILCLLAVGCSGRADPPPARGSGSRPGSAAAPAAPTARVEPGLPVAAGTWGPFGFYVAYPVVPRNAETWARQPAYLVVEAKTGESFVVDHARQIAFAPNRQHLVANIDGNVVVYDLATGTTEGTPVPITGDFSFTFEGRLAWAEPAGASYRIHLRNLGTRKDRVLIGLPIVAARPDRNHGAPEVWIGFDRNDHIVGVTPNALRVWLLERPNADVVIDGPIEAPTVTAEGVTYARVDDADHQTLMHIPLADRSVQHPPPVVFQRDPSCGAGDMQRHSASERCSADRYLVRGPHAFCVWDTATGRLQTSFGPLREDFHCTDDVAWVRDAPAGSPYTFFSALTGKPIARPPGLVTDPPQGPPGAHPLDLPSGRTTGYDSPRKDRINGVVGDRASLWSPDQHLLWQAPAPSDAVAIAFSRSELVASDALGRIWRLELATRRLRATQLPACELRGDDPILVAPDGRIAAPCVRDHQRTLVLEGAAAPIFAGRGDGANLTSATSPTSAAIAWDALDGVHAWSFPDGTERWTYAQPRAHALAISADGARFAVAGEPAPDAAGNTFAISIRDAANHELAAVHVPTSPAALALSPDGARLAVKLAGALTIYDATSGAVIDQLPVGPGAFAWDPSGKRLAYARTEPPGLGIRDVVARRDAETRPLPMPPDGPIHAIAWSPDGTRLALLADQRVTLWEPGGASSTLLFAGAGAVELRPDGSAVLLGDPAAARALIGCKLGVRSYPIARCANRLVSPP
jgi:WD40-like Beta Propeller Repeat